MDDLACSLVVLSAAGFDRGRAADPIAQAAGIVGHHQIRPAAHALAQPWLDAGGSVLSCLHPGWPQGLEDLGPAAPLLLWSRCEIPVQPDDAVAIVGSRQSTDYGRMIAADLAQAVAAGGRWVVSGGAVGIDAAAHESALDVGGRTLLIAAGGAGNVYPPKNAGLFERAAVGGGVLWEHPPGTRLSKPGFLRRNRLISAVAGSTVVVEAASRSGALNTARSAADLGRLVLGVPGPINSPVSAGVHRAVADGWAAMLVDREDLVALLGARRGCGLT